MCLIKHHAIKAYGEAEEEGHLSLINFPDRSPNCGRFAVLDRQPHRLSCRAGRLNIPEPGIEQPKTLTHACTHTHTHNVRYYPTTSSCSVLFCNPNDPFFFELLMIILKKQWPKNTPSYRNVDFAFTGHSMLVMVFITVCSAVTYVVHSSSKVS